MGPGPGRPRTPWVCSSLRHGHQAPRCPRQQAQSCRPGRSASVTDTWGRARPLAVTVGLWPRLSTGPGDSLAQLGPFRQPFPRQMRLWPGSEASWENSEIQSRVLRANRCVWFSQHRAKQREGCPGQSSSTRGRPGTERAPPRLLSTRSAASPASCSSDPQDVGVTASGRSGGSESGGRC